MSTSIGLIRLATLTSTTGTARPRPPARGRHDRRGHRATATASAPGTGRRPPADARTPRADSALRKAGRTTGAAAAAGRRAVDEHRPQVEDAVRRTLRGAGRLAGKLAGTQSPRAGTVLRRSADRGLTRLRRRGSGPMTETDDVLALAERLWAGDRAPADRASTPWPPAEDWRRSPTAWPSCPRSPTSPPCPPTRAWCSSTWAARSCRDRSTGPCAPGRTLPLHTAVYSHGHIDHVFGVHRWEADAEANGWPAPEVVAHEAVAARFDRYVRTAGYNAVVNRRQFGLDDLEWPTRYRYPDRTFRDRLDLDVGGVRAELHHARGETDDHAWTWFPDQRVLCTGDLFIWASPNAGNPQKVQRYPLEWAEALRRDAHTVRRRRRGPRGAAARPRLPDHGSGPDPPGPVRDGRAAGVAGGPDPRAA